MSPSVPARRLAYTRGYPVRVRRLTASVALLCLTLLACPGAEERAEHARARARQALASGERDAALDAIASLRSASGDTPEAIQEQALLLIQAGEAPAVVWLLEDARKRFPDSVALRLLLAQTALIVDDPVRAEALAKDVPEDSPDTGVALVVRARAALALGDLDAALALFRRAEALEPDRPELRAPRIAALLAERRFDQAAQALDEARRQSAGSEPDPFEPLELALQQYRAADARQRLGHAEQVGDSAAAAQAREELRAAVDALGERVATAPRQLGAWPLWVQEMLLSGRAAEAATALEAARAPDRLDLLPLLARVKLALADPAGAERALRELAERGPATACLPLSRFLSASGRGAEALALVEEALGRARGEPLLSLARAELLLDARSLDAARGALAGLPETPEAELLNARLVLAEGRAAEAARRLERLAPQLDTAATQFWLARALEASGDRAGAARRYALAAQRSPSDPGAFAELLRLARERGDWREAAGSAQQLVLRAPGLIDGWEGLVGALLHLGQATQAEAVATRASELLPQDPGPPLLRARALRAEGRIPEALRALDEAEQRGGDPRAIASERVLALGAGGRTAEALKSAERALESAPDAAVIQHARAVVLFAADRFEEGSQAVDRALALDPADPRPLRTRCRYAASRHLLEPARRDCERYLARRPDDAGVRFALGSVLAASGDGEGAIAAYRRAAALDPNAAAPRNNLAALLFERGELDAALEAAQQAYALADTNPQVLDTLGELYLARGLTDRAIALLETAHRLDPDLAAAELHLALAYQQAGRTPEARRHLSALLQRSDASPPVHEQARKALASL